MREEKEYARIKKKSLMLQPHHLNHFLYKFCADKKVRILDLGCGNDSAKRVRNICGDLPYYSGLDVGDYNLTDDSKENMNEYVVVEPEKFADTILKWEGQEDIIISNHNLEHCNCPDDVLLNITKSLKKGGHLYMAFPSEESVDFPKGFNGCLNYYDDSTHQKTPPSWEHTIEVLKNNRMKILYLSKRYSPDEMKKIGEINWPYSQQFKAVLPGIWEYFGFESIIWARKG